VHFSADSSRYVRPSYSYQDESVFNAFRNFGIQYSSIRSFTKQLYIKPSSLCSSVFPDVGIRKSFAQLIPTWQVSHFDPFPLHTLSQLLVSCGCILFVWSINASFNSSINLSLSLSSRYRTFFLLAYSGRLPSTASSLLVFIKFLVTVE